MTTPARPDRPLPAEQLAGRHEAAEHHHGRDKGDDHVDTRDQFAGRPADEPEPDEGRHQEADNTADDHAEPELEGRVQQSELPDRPRLDHPFPVAHGARALAVTFLVHVAAFFSWLASPSDHPDWALIVPCYAVNALIFFVFGRLQASGGIIPFGTIGEARFVIAVVATAMVFGHQDDPAVRDLPALMFLMASILCAHADGAWMAAITRHGRCTFRVALLMALREICSRQSGTWRIMTGGRP